MSTGILLAIVGIWLILRTVRSDQSGRTLVGHIVGEQPKKSAS